MLHNAAPIQPEDIHHGGRLLRARKVRPQENVPPVTIESGVENIKGCTGVDDSLDGVYRVLPAAEDVGVVLDVILGHVGQVCSGEIAAIEDEIGEVGEDGTLLIDGGGARGTEGAWTNL